MIEINGVDSTSTTSAIQRVSKRCRATSLKQALSTDIHLYASMLAALLEIPYLISSLVSVDLHGRRSVSRARFKLDARHRFEVL
jgi:hypothetical protein